MTVEFGMGLLALGRHGRPNQVSGAFALRLKRGGVEEVCTRWEGERESERG